MKPKKELASVLPLPAAQALHRASLTPIPVNDPLARLREIERVSERIRCEYRYLFRKENFL